MSKNVVLEREGIQLSERSIRAKRRQWEKLTGIIPEKNK